jgi:hypothetical protein
LANDRPRIADHLYIRTHNGLGAGHIQVCDHGDSDATAGAALDFFLVAFEHVESAGAYNANAHQAYLYRFHKFFK